MKIKNITYQNLWDTYTTRIREKFITLKAYFMWLPEVGGGWVEKWAKGVQKV